MTRFKSARKTSAIPLPLKTDLKDVFLAKVEDLVKASLAEGRGLEGAHGWVHLKSVSNNAAATVEALGGSEDQILAAKFGGLFHDLVRGDREDVDYEAESVTAAEKILEKVNAELDLPNFTQIKEDALTAAFTEATRKEAKSKWYSGDVPPRDVNLVRLAVHIADGFEKNGAFVVARRSQFVGGSRFYNRDGDLNAWKSKFQEVTGKPLTPEWCVLCEGFVRVFSKNGPDTYPPYLRAVSDPMFKRQLWFINSLMKHLGTDYQELATIIHDAEYPSIKGKGISLADLKTMPDRLPKRDGLEPHVEVTDEDIYAGAKIVRFFSHPLVSELDTNAAIPQFPAHSLRERELAGEMNDYINGGLADRILDLKGRPLHSDEAFATHLGLCLGSAYRTPVEARAVWGLTDIDEERIVKLYQAEWAATSSNPDFAELINRVEEAAMKAFGSNYSEQLRVRVGTEVAKTLLDRKEELLERTRAGDKIRILDIGSGPGTSVLDMWRQIDSTEGLEELKEHIEFVLLDPSKPSLDKAKNVVLKDTGITFSVMNCMDLDMREFLDEGSIDIAVGVASIHHHSKIPFDLYHEVLHPGGTAVFGDWHNSCWTHPALVKQFLETLEWKDPSHKEELIAQFTKCYPNANADIPHVPEEELQANKDIQSFWQAVIDLGAGRAIWALEGHRPVKFYQAGMIEVGFESVNSDRVFPKTGLLQITTGQKRA